MKKPITLTITKSQIQVSYKLKYLQTFNKGPIEQVVSTSVLGCTEGIFMGSSRLSDSTCSIMYDNEGNIVPDSQGFCCSCPTTKYLFGAGNSINRGDCGFLDGANSAHCLRFSEEWFAGYEVIKEIS